jgi:hypothetical protein
MSHYSRDTTEQLTAKRTALADSLHKRLTQPTAIAHGESSATYAQRTSDIKLELRDIDAELDTREGLHSSARPIYLVG